MITNEIPDIRTWIKNPTDFFRVRRGSEGMDQPWHPNDSHSTELPVTQPQILISISYLPTAERLSVVIVRTKIPQNFQPCIRFICAKAHLRDDRTGRRANKKKTRFVSLFTVTSSTGDTLPSSVPCLSLPSSDAGNPLLVPFLGNCTDTCSEYLL